MTKNYIIHESAIAYETVSGSGSCSRTVGLGRDSAITMADGKQKPIHDIVLSRDPGPILAVNPMGKVVAQPIIGWHRDNLAGRHWLHIVLSKAAKRNGSLGGLWVANDHAIRTARGWVRADELETGSEVMTGHPALNESQRQVVVGTMLGDGCITRNPESVAQALALGQCAEQRDWMETKMGALGGIRWSPIRGARFLQATTQGSLCFSDYRELWYPDDMKRIPRSLIEDVFSPLMLATWYMDDGTLHQRKKWGRGSAVFCTHAFHDDDNDWLCELLSSYGFNCHLATKRSANRRPYHFVYVTSDGSVRLFEYIAPCVVPSMRYKLPSGVPAYDPATWSIPPANRYWNTVESISRGACNGLVATYGIDIPSDDAVIAGGAVVRS